MGSTDVDDKETDYRLPIAGRPRLQDATPHQLRQAVLYYRTADKYRSPEAQELLNLFAESRGRFPNSLDELNRWAASAEGEAALSEHTETRGKTIP